MKPHSTEGGWLARAPAFLIGLLLTGVGLVFNSTYGYSLGGDNALRGVGMAAVFIACIGLKDWMLGQVIMACKTRRLGLALVCAIAMTLGSMASFLAAFGSASEGQNEKSDPRAAQILAFRTAEKTAADAERQLADLGRVLNITEAQAKASSALVKVDPGIAKRTAGCTNFPTDVGKRVQAVNREACQPVIEAKALVAKAEQAASLQAKLDAARETIAQGAPATADALGSNLSALWGKITGQQNIEAQSVVSLLIALVVELGAPISWAVFQMQGTARVPEPVQNAKLEPKVRRRTGSVPPGGGVKRPRSEFQKGANLIAKEMRERGETPKFHIVRSEFQKRYGKELPKVTAHRACA